MSLQSDGPVDLLIAKNPIFLHGIQNDTIQLLTDIFTIEFRESNFHFFSQITHYLHSTS